MKKWLLLWITAVLLLAMPVSVYAHTVPDIERTDGMIEVVLCDDGAPVVGGELKVVRVGYIYEENGDYSFHRFVDDAPVEEVQSAATAESMVQFFQSHKEQYAFDTLVSSVGEEGKVQFQGLEMGLYLIMQDVPAPGYSAIKPFLVTLPYMQDGEYCYRISSAVKTALEREPVPTEPEPTKPSGDKLPQTGQLNWPVPVLAVCGLVCVLIGIALRSGCKKEV